MNRSRAGILMGARRVLLLGTMAAGFLFLPSALVSPQSADAYVVCSLECPHEYQASKAMEVYAAAPFANPEVAANFAAIQSGVTHEDEHDHIYGLNAKDPISGDPILATSTHFWDADAGPFAVTHNAHPFGDFANSLQKARMFWSLALGRYADGDKLSAYHYLGHIVHFFGDHTIPAHAHDEPHGPEPLNDDAFHDWMDVQGNPPPNAALTPTELSDLKSAGPLAMPSNEPDKLMWLLYVTNQIADFFASDGTDGDASAASYSGNPAAITALQQQLNSMANDPGLAGLQDHDELANNDDGDDDDDGDLSVIRRYSYLPGIRSIAALYQLFDQTARQQLTLTVVIDRVHEDQDKDDHDLGGPDFYASVTIAGAEARNRGEQQEDEEEINPHWAFGKTVGTSGSIPVRIEIWDEDGDWDDNGPFALDDDDPSDIDSTGDEDDAVLEFDVDLGKCLRREPGAIVGDDITAACGGKLSQSGDSDPASEVDFRIFMSKSPPTANAGGPYTTNEGADVTLDGTGSSDPDNDIVKYEWDFDDDGQCDDATGAKPTFTAVGQDGTKDVKLCVTDAVGLTDDATTTVTINNVAPSLSVSSNAPTGENTTVTVSGTISDPGWLDPLSGTITWGDGSAAQSLGGTVENVRPDATLTFSVTHVFGDNGSFIAQICAADDRTTPCTSFPLQITNTPPTAAIDLSGAVDVNGTPTVIAHAGSSVSFSGRATDPGSDDLTLTWIWGDGTAPTAATRLVNPPNLDPAVSPTIQPRDEVLASAHAFTGACAYETTFGVGDDDGGSASHTAAVIILGNGHPNQPPGYWKQQFRFFNSGKGNADFDATRLGCYVKIVDYMSRAFHQQTDASTFLRAEDVLETNLTSDILELFDQQLLAAWLNFANGAVEWNRLVDSDGDKKPDARFLDAIAAAETLRLDPGATRLQLDRMKTIVAGWTKLP